MYGRWTVMSRIGNRVLNIPAGVEVTLDGNKITTKGPKGTLEYTFKMRMLMFKLMMAK